MKILLFIDDLGGGGAQRQLVFIGKCMGSYGHKITVLTYSGNSFYQEELVENGIDVFTLDEKRLNLRIIRIRKFIRTGGFDIIISFLGPPNFLNIISAFPYRKWKVIVNERSTDPAILKSLKSRIIRILYLFADMVVSNSHANIKLVCKVNPLLSFQKCRVIYNGVDLNIFKPLCHFKFRDKGILKIVVAASYRKLKNIINLIEALNMLSSYEQEQLIVEWYGNKIPGLFRDDILNDAINLVKKYNLHSVIQLLPFNNGILNVIQNADVVGLFSYFEGLPNAICEGMACGKPIISTDISDIPDFVSNHINGVLCQADNVWSIANALRYLINSSSEQLENMGRISRQKAECYFDNKKIVNQYLNLIEI